MGRSLHDLVRPAIVAGLILAIAPSMAMPSFAGSPEAPFGDKVSGAIVNYNRATPNVATSGRYPVAAIAEIKALGFTTIIELRGPDEKGVAENAKAARMAGLNFIRIPVTTRVPSDAQVRQFARAAEDAANYPILVSCVSANRVGAMWALYRAQAGVAAVVAVEEGRTAGLKSREAAVRNRLGLPAIKP